MNKKILSVVESVSHQKLLPREKIFEALEIALSIATQKKYTQEIYVRVNINRQNGNFNTFRRWIIVNKVNHPTKEITLEAARFENESAQLNEFIEDEIQSVNFDRITTQIAKTIIIKKVKAAERMMVTKKFYNLKGKIVNGIVKKIHRDYILLELKHSIHAIITKENMLPKEIFRVGDRICGILYDIQPKKKGIQLFVSRSKVSMLQELLRIEVPEILKNIIEIKAISRNPGFRSKIAVKTNNVSIDPIGACVGLRGIRVQSISKEFCGEKIDIILWNANPAKFVINAISPVNIISIIVHKEINSMDILVDVKNLPQVIGKYGQNIRLISSLVGWELNVMQADDIYKKSKKKIYHTNDILIKKLDINVNILNILFKEGLTSIGKLICIPFLKLLEIKELKKDMIYELKDKLSQYISMLLLKKRYGVKKNKNNILKNKKY
ncbi:transcription termination factor NusA [Buchnera aphidicola]|uniref:transcription termination factor NusA n=1 Tax=Buchnera aphidicola TaxID=9 RepID=UPI0034641003